MTKENEKDKLNYMTNKLTLIDEIISMHENMIKTEKVAEMIKRKGSAQSVYGSLLRI